MTYLWQLLLLCAVSPITGCAHSQINWSYTQPPQISDSFSQSEKILWCYSRSAAQFSAITGWFGPGCQNTYLATGYCRVIEIAHETFDTTHIYRVRCKGVQGDIWLPLPSHQWA